MGNDELILVILSLKNESNKLGKSSSVKSGYDEFCLLPSILCYNFKRYLVPTIMLHRNKLAMSKHSYIVNDIDTMFIFQINIFS